MHDVGKLVVPNHLLNKPGKLTAEEFAIVRKHEDVSVEILTTIEFLAPVAPSATSEAAQFSPVADDHGQPIEPHIVAVADAYDAMTSTRSYRRALTQDIAFAELRKNSGRQFHPRVVDALIASLRRRGAVHGDGHELYVHHMDAPRDGVGSAGLGDLLPDGDAGDGTSAVGHRGAAGHEPVRLAPRVGAARRGDGRGGDGRRAVGAGRPRRPGSSRSPAPSSPASSSCCGPATAGRCRCRTPTCS